MIAAPTKVDAFLRYFDLFRDHRLMAPTGQSDTNKSDVRSQLLLNVWLALEYLALFLGVLSKQFIDYFNSQAQDLIFSQKTVAILTQQFILTAPRVILALIIATALFPAVYRRSVGQSRPGFVQLCVVFTSGLGYMTIVSVK